jgi:hypothetical protein
MLHIDGLPFKLSMLAIGGSILFETIMNKQSVFLSRIKSAKKSPQLADMEFACATYECFRTDTSSTKKIHVLKITRMANTPSGKPVWN